MIKFWIWIDYCAPIGVRVSFAAHRWGYQLKDHERGSRKHQ